MSDLDEPRLPAHMVREDDGWTMDVAFPVAGGQRVFDLAQPMHVGMPHFPSHPPFSFSLSKRHGDVVPAVGTTGASELITTGGHVGTHIDAFSHVARDGRLYGGVEIVGRESYTEGMAVHAVDQMAPLLAPGHLVDLPTLWGRDVRPDDGVGAADLAAWFEGHGTVPAPGDVVLVRTGWDEKWHDPATFASGAAPGLTIDGAIWLSQRGVRAAGTDTIAFERLPSPELAAHVHLLVESGISILETLFLRELAAAQAWSFFLVAVPLRLRGATGSPLRPLAVVPQ